MSEATRWVLDTGKLAGAIETVRRYRGITGRDVAAETGLSPSTLTRLGQGQKPDADALVSLLKWLKAEACEFAAERTP